MLQLTVSVYTFIDITTVVKGWYDVDIMIDISGVFFSENCTPVIEKIGMAVNL